MSSSLRAALLAWALALAACDSCPESPPPLTVELGAGIAQFVPLVNGDQVDLIMGPQGGYHLWSSLRVSGVTSDDGLITDLWVQLAGDDAVLDSTRVRPSYRLSSSGLEASGLTDRVSVPQSVRGRDIIMGARITAPRGRSAEDTRSVHVR